MSVPFFASQVLNLTVRKHLVHPSARFVVLSVYNVSQFASIAPLATYILTFGDTVCARGLTSPRLH